MEIRGGRPEDLEQLVALTVLVRPYALSVRAGVAEWLKEGAHVAEDHGQVVGWAALREAPWLKTDNAYALQLLVHPERRRQGIGTALLRVAEQSLERLPSLRLQAMADETGVEFARRAGFTQVAELTYAGVDLTDEPPQVPVPDGLTLVPFADLTAQDVFPAYRETCQDIPGGSAIDPAYDWYEEHVWANDLFDNGLSLAVVDSGRVVAFTISQRADDRLWTDMTGTVGSHRGRGLATVVKSAALTRAREAGVRSAYTAMNLTNAPMLAANHRLGYRPVGSRVQLTKVR